MIVVGTEISSGGRAHASKRVAMQACTVDRFPVPYRTVTVPYIGSENGDTAYKHSPGCATYAQRVPHCFCAQRVCVCVCVSLCGQCCCKKLISMLAGQLHETHDPS